MLPGPQAIRQRTGGDRLGASDHQRGDPPTATRRFISQVEDITEVRHTRDLLEKRALFDQPTGLPNGTLLIDRLDHAIRSHSTRQTAVAVLFCDVDHFSIINDSLGHKAGDTLLGVIAQRIQSSVRPGDTVARYGGDEFIVILENLAGLDAATETAASIMAAVHSPVRLSGHERVPTMSIGVSIMEGQAASEALAMLTDGLGLFGIIEGIESEAQHDKARSPGWRFGQGFLYGRPLPERELPLEVAGREFPLAPKRDGR